jgi:hypothetical protein
VGQRKQSQEHEQSQVDNDACAQQPHSEHEHHDKKTKQEYLAQQVRGEEHQRDTLL